MSFAIHLIGLASGEPSPFDGQWLVHYDPNTWSQDEWGRVLKATVVTTPDRSSARKFADFAAVHACWSQVAAPPGHQRADGRPNRPLTAFTMAIEKVP